RAPERLVPVPSGERLAVEDRHESGVVIRLGLRKDTPAAAALRRLRGGAAPCPRRGLTGGDGDRHQRRQEEGEPDWSDWTKQMRHVPPSFFRVLTRLPPPGQSTPETAHVSSLAPLSRQPSQRRTLICSRRDP